MKTVALVLSALLGLYLAAGCGSGGKDCSSLCKEGQAGKCTSIKGDCDKFCGSLEALAGPANCTSQKSAYLNCLGKAPAACATSCGSEESATTTCYVKYCTANLTNQDCMTLAASF